MEFQRTRQFVWVIVAVIRKVSLPIVGCLQGIVGEGTLGHH